MKIISLKILFFELFRYLFFLFLLLKFKNNFINKIYIIKNFVIQSIQILIEEINKKINNEIIRKIKFLNFIFKF